MCKYCDSNYAIYHGYCADCFTELFGVPDKDD